MHIFIKNLWVGGRLIGACLFGLFSVLMSATTQAAFVSTVDVAGDFDIYNFSPLLDSDSNPFTYNVDLRDLTGKAEFNLPASGTALEWFVTGEITAEYGGATPLPPSIFANESIFGGPVMFGGITAESFIYDFDNQSYTNTSGSFSLPAIGLPATLAIDYDILALDVDGIVNDVALSIVELSVDPALSVSAVLSGLDAAPLSLTDGRIDGSFAMDFVATASVPEPGTALLLGLGLVGFGYRARKVASSRMLQG